MTPDRHTLEQKKSYINRRSVENQTKDIISGVTKLPVIKSPSVKINNKFVNQSVSEEYHLNSVNSNSMPRAKTKAVLESDYLSDEMVR